MPNIICPECKTENEPEYMYCKNCGKPLAAKASEPVSQYVSGAQNGGFYGGVQGDLIDGNTVEEVCTFVGKNAGKIVPAFVKLGNTGTKVSWSWPAFIFGFFFGPIGVAIWFLYRKMYGIASIFAAIGVFINYVSYALDRFLGINSSAKGLENYFQDFIDGKVGYEALTSVLTDKTVVFGTLVSSAYSAVSIICAVLAGVFGVYLYKRHTAKSIAGIKATVTDVSFMKIALASKGGTSVGAVILGLIIMTFISNLPDTVSAVIKAKGVVLS